MSIDVFSTEGYVVGIFTNEQLRRCFIFGRIINGASVDCQLIYESWIIHSHNCGCGVEVACGSVQSFVVGAGSEGEALF